MPIKVAIPPTYTPQALPVLDGGGSRYAQNELQRIKSILSSYADLLPRAANVPPQDLIDGMIRLSRDPWRPVSGQTADAWVYFDAAASLWRFLGTAPTNT